MSNVSKRTHIRSLTLCPIDDVRHTTRVKRNVPVTVWLGGTIEDINTYFAAFVPAGWKIVNFSDRTAAGDAALNPTE